ncbi:degenerate transposase [Streptococcus pneumoniae]|nr:degenerate transposase [Streptococcus pneumoniae]
MSRVRVQIMNQLDRKSHEYKAIKRYWKLIQQDSRKLSDKHFYHDFSCLPEIMSWDEYAFTKGKMSFIAQDFNNLNIITVLEGRTQAVIRDHFLKYDRAVRCRVKIITMDMFSPYYDLAKQLRFQISRLRLKQSPRLFHSRMLKSFLIAFTLYNILAVL